MTDTQMTWAQRLLHVALLAGSAYIFPLALHGALRLGC